MIHKNYLLLFSIVFFSFSCSMNRPFSKRLLGNYQGTQEEYSIKIDDKRIIIPADQFNANLSYDELIIKNARRVQKASYTIKATTKEFYSLEVLFEDGTIENWRLYKKGKKLERMEANPRPSTILLKN